MKRNIQENIVHGREDEVPEKEIIQVAQSSISP